MPEILRRPRGAGDSEGRSALKMSLSADCLILFQIQNIIDNRGTDRLGEMNSTHTRKDRASLLLLLCFYAVIALWHRRGSVFCGIFGFPLHRPKLVPDSRIRVRISSDRFEVLFPAVVARISPMRRSSQHAIRSITGTCAKSNQSSAALSAELIQIIDNRFDSKGIFCRPRICQRG